MNIKQKLEELIVASKTAFFAGAETVYFDGEGYTKAVPVEELRKLLSEVDSYRTSLIEAGRKAGRTEGVCERQADKLIDDTVAGDLIAQLRKERGRPTAMSGLVERAKDWVESETRGVRYEKAGAIVRDLAKAEVSADAKLRELRAWIEDEGDGSGDLMVKRAYIVDKIGRLLATPPSASETAPERRPSCDLCGGFFGLSGGKTDTDGHGLGECAPICSTCGGSGSAAEEARGSSALLAEAKKVAEWLQTMLEGRPLSRMLCVDFGRQFIEPFLEAIKAEESCGPSARDRNIDAIYEARDQLDAAMKEVAALRAMNARQVEMIQSREGEIEQLRKERDEANARAEKAEFDLQQLRKAAKSSVDDLRQLRKHRDEAKRTLRLEVAVTECCGVVEAARVAVDEIRKLRKERVETTARAEQAEFDLRQLWKLTSRVNRDIAACHDNLRLRWGAMLARKSLDH